jgi:hypothetical protein
MGEQVGEERQQEAEAAGKRRDALVAEQMVAELIEVARQLKTSRTGAPQRTLSDR